VVNNVVNAYSAALPNLWPACCWRCSACICRSVLRAGQRRCPVTTSMLHLASHRFRWSTGDLCSYGARHGRGAAAGEMTERNHSGRSSCTTVDALLVPERRPVEAEQIRNACSCVEAILKEPVNPSQRHPCRQPIRMHSDHWVEWLRRCRSCPGQALYHRWSTMSCGRHRGINHAETAEFMPRPHPGCRGCAFSLYSGPVHRPGTC